MTLEIWLSFIVASSILCFAPGPIIFMVMGQALTHGHKSALPLIAGVFIGDLFAMFISLAGLGLLLATSATIFSLLKWLAASYLIYLGIKSWLKKGASQPIKNNQLLKKSIFRQSFLVATLNPKALVFYSAFFPLFIEPAKPVFEQILILGFTFQLVSMMSTIFYFSFSSHLHERVGSIKFQRHFNKVSGGLLVGAGVVTASIGN